MIDAVEQYVRGLQARDWEVMRETMRADVYREGAEGVESDAIEGLDAYMGWTVGLLGSLHTFEWTPTRLSYSEDRRSAFVESVTRYIPNEGDTPFGYSLAVVFDLDADGLIARISFYWKTPSRRLAGDTIASGGGPL